MKKSWIIIFAVGIIVCVMMLILHISSGEKDLAQNKKVKENMPSYFSKSYYDEKEDGWVYGFEIDSYPANPTRNGYIFDGYNLKYKELKDYYVAIFDENGFEIGNATSNYITLSISKEYKDEVSKINKFFNKKQFKGLISSSDLEDIVLEHFDKNYIVELYNKAYQSQQKNKLGKYAYKPFVGRYNIESDNQNMKGEWQISYINDYGYLNNVNIEFIDENGNYLSDIVKDENADKDIIELYNDVQKIEKEIINSQTIYSSKLSLNIKNSGLKQLLSEFHNEMEEQ